jgi:ABC-type nitrate/sulfonate/bicarbonate transport system substrate-binding protein
MDIRSSEHLKRILAKDISILTDEDKRYLHARQSFLTAEQKAKFSIGENKENKTTYAEYMEQAKKLGYAGKKIKIEELKQYIEDHK